MGEQEQNLALLQESQCSTQATFLPSVPKQTQSSGQSGLGPVTLPASWDAVIVAPAAKSCEWACSSDNLPRKGPGRPSPLYHHLALPKNVCVPSAPNPAHSCTVPVVGMGGQGLFRSQLSIYSK